MSKIYFLAITIFLCIVGVSCQDDFKFVTNQEKLSFSKDTVYLDTVFSNIGSSTYTLKVYNRSKNNILIPKIELAKGQNSKYRITVDGRSEDNKSFQNVELLAQDSLYIFVETTANIKDANPTDYLYTDEIVFDSGSLTQKVPLVTLIQDAIFLYPKRFEDGTTETLPIGDVNIYGFNLSDEQLHFENKKPYVIYGYAAVPQGKTAVFDAGARVYFHANSGLIVANQASIKVNGAPSVTKSQENEVIFQGDRLESIYDDIVGQWGTIWLTNGSTDNQIDHLTIKNATIGLLIQNHDNTTTTIKNTQIYNCQNYGIWAQTAHILGQNLVINNCGQASLMCSYGGNYQFDQCTFANFWSNTKQVAVGLTNYFEGAIPETKDLEKATFNNCIIYGNYPQELALSRKTTSAFQYFFDHCLIQFDQSTVELKNHPDYQFSTDNAHYNQIILNQNPLFKEPSKNLFQLKPNSPAIQKANTQNQLLQDILGITRKTPADLGAYQFLE